MGDGTRHSAQGADPVGAATSEPAQFLAICRRSKWSKHVTHAPRLALLAMAGSKAACKIRAACSHALRCRTFRKNGKKPAYPGRLRILTPRNTRRYGLSLEHRHSARFSCPSPRAYSFFV